jgi:hypothetical protein
MSPAADRFVVVYRGVDITVYRTLSPSSSRRPGWVAVAGSNFGPDPPAVSTAVCRSADEALAAMKRRLDLTQRDTP